MDGVQALASFRPGKGQRAAGGACLGAAARVGGGRPRRRPVRNRAGAQPAGGSAGPGGVDDRGARSTAFWLRMTAAAALTIASLMLRSLRWIFLVAAGAHPHSDPRRLHRLLRRPQPAAGAIPAGEIGLRAVVHRARGDVPAATVVVVNLWERLLDLVALGHHRASGDRPRAAAHLECGPAGWFSPDRRPHGPARMPDRRRTSRGPPPTCSTRACHPTRTLVDGRTWLAGIIVSLAAWVLPGLGFWIVANGWGRPLSLATAETPTLPRRASAAWCSPPAASSSPA